MKTKPHITLESNPTPRTAPPATPSRRSRPGLSLTAAVTACALLKGALSTVTAANILENDLEQGFKPTITLSQNASESAVVDRSSRIAVYGKKTNPEKISAVIVGNLAGFPFTDIAEDMPVSLRVGNFAFAATLGEDVSRLKNRDGSPRPFDPNKTTAVFLLRAPAPPVLPGGEPRLRTMGSVKLAWNLQRLVARVVLTDVAAVGADSILSADEDLFPETSTARTFSCEKIPVEITFGSATGSRLAYGRGRLATSIRKFGTARDGNLTTVPLYTVAMIGEADTTAPILVARVPSVDEAPQGIINFNGTVTDMAAKPLTGEVAPVEIIVTVDGTELTGGTEETDAFRLHITEGDAKGMRIFSIAGLPVAASAPKVVLVTLCAKDASGNLSLLLARKVSVRSVATGVTAAVTF